MEIMSDMEREIDSEREREKEKENEVEGEGDYCSYFHEILIMFITRLHQ